ncbi:MAG: hypothetical protein RL376_24 [Verrucomicrobiota bacterium]
MIGFKQVQLENLRELLPAMNCHGPLTGDSELPPQWQDENKFNPFKKLIKALFINRPYSCLNLLITFNCNRKATSHSEKIFKHSTTFDALVNANAAFKPKTYLLSIFVLGGLKLTKWNRSVVFSSCIKHACFIRGRIQFTKNGTV